MSYHSIFSSSSMSHDSCNDSAMQAATIQAVHMDAMNEQMNEASDILGTEEENGVHVEQELNGPTDIQNSCPQKYG